MTRRSVLASFFTSLTWASLPILRIHRPRGGSPMAMFDEPINWHSQLVLMRRSVVMSKQCEQAADVTHRLVKDRKAA